MAKLKIVTVPNPILRKKAKAVSKIDKKVLKLAQNMIETIKTGPEGPIGVGLSAPQVGKLLKISAVFSNKSKKYLTLINPEILWYSKSLTDGVPESKNRFEGCLSIPGYFGIVKRSQKIKVCYKTLSGKTLTREFSGFTATVIQHEYDHLNGVLFIDRIFNQKGKLYKAVKGENGESGLEEINLPGLTK